MSKYLRWRRWWGENRRILSSFVSADSSFESVVKDLHSENVRNFWSGQQINLLRSHKIHQFGAFVAIGKFHCYKNGSWWIWSQREYKNVRKIRTLTSPWLSFLFVGFLNFAPIRTFTLAVNIITGRVIIALIHLLNIYAPNMTPRNWSNYKWIHRVELQIAIAISPF